MRRDGLSEFLGRVRLAAAAREAESDGELLGRFAATGDGAAFEALVARHGPSVWAVCRRALPPGADREGAFQAVFLVLARRAGSLRGHGPVGGWLFAVAVRVAARARRGESRRAAREAADTPGRRAEPGPDAAAELAELRAAVDAAVAALPERERAAVVLCHLEGLSYAEAARRLGCPRGTVGTLLGRAAGRLRRRLAGREFALAVALAAAAGGVPSRLSAATVEAAGAVRLGMGAGVPPAVGLLTEAVMRSMFFAKLKAGVAAAVLAAGVGLGAGACWGPAVAAGDTGPSGAGNAWGGPRARDDRSAGEGTLEAQVRELRRQVEGLARENRELKRRLGPDRPRTRPEVPDLQGNPLPTLPALGPPESTGHLVDPVGEKVQPMRASVPEDPDPTLPTLGPPVPENPLAPPPATGALVAPQPTGPPVTAARPDGGRGYNRGGATVEDRLSRVTEQLDQLRREVEALRREVRKR